jgi:hypothetical protein
MLNSGENCLKNNMAATINFLHFSIFFFYFLFFLVLSVAPSIQMITSKTSRPLFGDHYSTKLRLSFTETSFTSFQRDLSFFWPKVATVFHGNTNKPPTKNDARV